MNPAGARLCEPQPVRTSRLLRVADPRSEHRFMGSPWERVVGGRVLGSKEFAAQAVKRFGRMLADDAERERFVRRLRRALEK